VVVERAVNARVAVRRVVLDEELRGGDLHLSPGHVARDLLRSLLRARGQ
jgi:hypothetical protein